MGVLFINPPDTSLAGIRESAGHIWTGSAVGPRSLPG